MRLIDLDAIMAQFPDADFDGDVIENMKAYPDWRIGIVGLIDILKAVSIIEQSEDCISREDAIRIAEQGQIQGYEWQFKELCNLPSVTPSYNSINTELKPCEDCISREEAKKLIQGKIDDIPKNKDGTYGSMFGQYVNGLYCAKTAISYMPSVVPHTKRGNWIKTKDECEGVNFYDFSFECTKCGKEQSFKPNFCPWCGANLRYEKGET